MKSEVSRSAKLSTDAQDHASQLETLYITCYSELNEFALDHPQVSVTQAYEILRGLTQYLSHYQGSLDSREDFIAWSKQIISPARDFVILWEESELIVLKAIWSVLNGALDLCGNSKTAGKAAKYVAKELLQDVRVWAFEHLADLVAPDQPAQPATRLHEVGYWKARAWKTEQLRKRARFAAINDLEGVGRNKSGRIVIEPKNAP